LNPSRPKEFCVVGPARRLERLPATFPVAVYPAASESERISFNQLHRQTGHRIKYLKVDAETGDEGVAIVGLLCGGFTESSLRQARCIEVYAGPAALFARFDATPLAK
jgi:hypothetical protein